jgi:hypothetical protein
VTQANHHVAQGSKAALTVGQTASPFILNIGRQSLHVARRFRAICCISRLASLFHSFPAQTSIFGCSVGMASKPHLIAAENDEAAGPSGFDFALLR